jgi:serine/threonine protein kinase
MYNLYGGKLIDTGTKSCILSPNITCNKKKKKKNNNVSKISYRENSHKIIKREKQIGDIISRISGSKKWALTFDTLCKPPVYKDIIKMDNEIINCFKKYDNYLSNNNYIESYNKNRIMLVGEKGGITLQTYFKNLVNGNKLNKNFINMMKKIKNVLFGLVQLNKNNIIHLDLTAKNIVLSNNTFKIIDFGLSNISSNKEYFIKKSNYEFDNNRLYLFYPIDFIFYNKSIDKINNELKKIKTEGVDDFRNNADVYYSIHKKFNRDPDKDIKIALKNKLNDTEFTKMIKSVDTYSFGILFIYLFNYYDINYENKCIKDFFKLFKKMTEPNYKNRILIDEAYIIFCNLLNKYSNKKTRKKTRRK